MFIDRHIWNRLVLSLARSPVVLLTGARQTGKTTLIQQLQRSQGYTYITFDDLRYLSAVQNDPMGFIEQIQKPVILDEVQRVPALFLSIKQFVDQHRQPGLFALTGSANPLLLPRLGDSLAGRMELIELFPFTQGEILGKKDSFMSQIFGNNVSNMPVVPVTKKELCDKLIKGGFPPVQNLDKQGVDAWMHAYLTTLLQRDVKDLARIEGLAQLPDLLHLLATRAGGLLNVAELSRASGLSVTTLHRYITLLEMLFLMIFQAPWSKNLGKRLVKSPKVYLVDAGILVHLLRVDATRLCENPNLFGKVFENFVVTELYKLATWHDQRIALFHYRSQSGCEVDVVLEDASGNIVGIEIKGSQTVISDDFKGLRKFQEDVGADFKSGIVLYMGNVIIPFGSKLWAVPVGALWG